uniref:Lipase domain-containing protein n=1 Tax=Graphocephala atropunctata TaxID=36148 RepID=A0A1B6MCF6_9HEMI
MCYGTNNVLSNRASNLEYKEVNIGNIQELYDGGFNLFKSTKILIHGWLDSATNKNYFVEQVREAYLLAEDVNIIAVNWPRLAMSFYSLSRIAVTPVGRYTAEFVDFLISEVGVSPASLHLLGHSLGAHIVGVVGESVTFGNLSRITGLDPAAPLFNPDVPNGRLDASDAEFVDVIHTEGGIVGYYEPCGHVDFYPNGGSRQPGCGADYLVCSHRRSYKYFAESVTSDGFISTTCDTWEDYEQGQCTNNTKTVMGENVDISANGCYYLYTNPSRPYAKWNSSDTFQLEDKKSFTTS